MPCFNCKHFKSAKLELRGSADGYCTRFPPAAETVIMPSGVPIQATTWPCVKDGDNCGEFQEHVRINKA